LRYGGQRGEKGGPCVPFGLVRREFRWGDGAALLPRMKCAAISRRHPENAGEHGEDCGKRLQYEGRVHWMLVGESHCDDGARFVRRLTNPMLAERLAEIPASLKIARDASGRAPRCPPNNRETAFEAWHRSAVDRADADLGIPTPRARPPVPRGRGLDREASYIGEENYSTDEPELRALIRSGRPAAHPCDGEKLDGPPGHLPADAAAAHAPGCIAPPRGAGGLETGASGGACGGGGMIAAPSAAEPTGCAASARRAARVDRRSSSARPRRAARCDRCRSEYDYVRCEGARGTGGTDQRMTKRESAHRGEPENICSF
jgi:hypothetical protein